MGHGNPGNLALTTKELPLFLDPGLVLVGMPQLSYNNAI
jgi:hypothetical protein